MPESAPRSARHRALRRTRQKDRRRRVALTAALAVAALLWSGALATSGAFAAASPGVNVTWTTANSWPSGFQSAVTVANDTGTTLKPWQVRFTFPQKLISIWSAVSVASPAGTLTVSAPSWATTLAPGRSAQFGLTAARSGTAAIVPTACTVVGLPAGVHLPCTVNGGALGTSPTATPSPTRTLTAAPKPTRTPIPTPTPTPTPAPSPTPGATGPLVAPYVDLGLWPTADVSSFAASAGVHAVTAAFVVADRSSACSPTWAGYTAYTIGGSQDFQADLRSFQTQGGRVVASFGGAANDELARVCTDPAKLLAAYSTVVTRFGLDRVDFDIEGADVSDSASNVRRAAAVAALQRQRAAAGHPLQVTLTLPVMPYGLLSSGLRTVSEFTAAGVQLSAVDVMAMDYGTGVTDMGAAAISAATSVAGQLKSVAAYASWTDARRLSLVALTPMLGLNDTGEVFTLADATTVGRYAAANGLAGLAWWELTRDQPCTQGIPAYMCSGTAQPRWAYSRAFVAAAG